MTNMKFFAPLAVAAVVAMGYVGYRAYSPLSEKDALLLENVEALSDGEDECHYVNGYAAFTGNPGGGYDCCKVWVNRAPDSSEGHCR